MKTAKYCALGALVLMATACDKHTVEYNSAAMPEDMAEVQLHYVCPVKTGSANNIVQVEFNGKLLNNNTTPLSPYNAIPSGRVGAFFAVDQGQTNIKFYKRVGKEDMELVYDRSTTLKKGKQNVFVYHFDADPIVIDNGFPYSTDRTTYDTDSICWIRAYNFLFGPDGTTPYCQNGKKLQVMYRDPISKDTLALGAPMGFGEYLDWSPVKILKTEHNSSGSQTVSFFLREINADGSYQWFQTLNSNNILSQYRINLTLYIGRRYHRIISGMMGEVYADQTMTMAGLTAL